MTDGFEGMDDLQRRLAALADTRQFLGKVGLTAVAYAKDTVQRKTGNLGRTIRLGQVTENSAQIIAGGQNGVGYAQVVESGSGLYGPKHAKYEIVPKYKKALAWGGARRLSGSLKSGSKATMFAKKVMHPGVKPRPYLRPAAERAVSETGIALLIKAWNDAA